MNQITEKTPRATCDNLVLWQDVGGLTFSPQSLSDRCTHLSESKQASRFHLVRSARSFTEPTHNVRLGPPCPSRFFTSPSHFHRRIPRNGHRLHSVTRQSQSILSGRISDRTAACEAHDALTCLDKRISSLSPPPLRQGVHWHFRQTSQVQRGD